MTWFNHWYQWQFAHYCIIALSAPTFNSLFLNRLSQHPQLPSLITPWANITATQDTSRKGCASPCAIRSVVVRPSRRESWRNGCGLRMAYASHKPPSPSPWNAVMSSWRWRRTPMSRPRDLHCVPVRLCSIHRWSLRSNTSSLSSRTTSTWTETCCAWRRHASCKSFIWCSRDGVLTRLAGKVQRPARDQVISPSWGKRRVGHGSWRAPKSRGETHLKVSQSQVAESWDLVARSRLPTLERGRGSSWEPRD